MRVCSCARIRRTGRTSWNACASPQTIGPPPITANRSGSVGRRADCGRTTQRGHAGDRSPLQTRRRVRCSTPLSDIGRCHPQVRGPVQPGAADHEGQELDSALPGVALLSGLRCRRCRCSRAWVRCAVRRSSPPRPRHDHRHAQSHVHGSRFGACAWSSLR